MNSMADKKAAKREKMMNMPSYRLMVKTADIDSRRWIWSGMLLLLLIL